VELVLRKIIDVSVFEDEISEFPGKPDEFIDFWTDKINMIPEHYRNNAVIYISSEYDSHYIDISVAYSRDETDKEKYHRESEEKARKDSARLITQVNELNELKRLKEKYE
jgi:hypothetical protein